MLLKFLKYTAGSEYECAWCKHCQSLKVQIAIKRPMPFTISNKYIEFLAIADESLQIIFAAFIPLYPLDKVI